MWCVCGTSECASKGIETTAGMGSVGSACLLEEITQANTAGFKLRSMRSVGEILKRAAKNHLPRPTPKLGELGQPAGATGKGGLRGFLPPLAADG